MRRQWSPSAPKCVREAALLAFCLLVALAVLASGAASTTHLIAPDMSPTGPCADAAGSARLQATTAFVIPDCARARLDPGIKDSVAQTSGFGLRQSDPVSGSVGVHVLGKIKPSDSKSDSGLHGFPATNRSQPLSDSSLGGSFISEPSTAQLANSPMAHLSLASLNFDPQLVGTASRARLVRLTNAGSAPLNIISIVASGDFADFTTCRGSLAPGRNCVIVIRFTPTTAGARAGAITITDNDPGSPQMIALSGTGIAKPSPTPVSSSPLSPVPSSTPPPGPVVSLSASSLTFGFQLVGTTSSAQTITLSNTGTGPLTLTATVFNRDFAQTNTCGGSVQAGASCTITVTFTPSVASPRRGAIRILDNATPRLQRVALYGAGSLVGLSSASLNFPAQLVGTISPVQTVSLTNYGSTPLTVFSILASGDFAQANICGGSVLPGASCTVSISFTPTWPGSRAGALTFSDSDPSYLQTVSLLGTAQPVTSSVSVTPHLASVTFTQTQQFQATVSGTSSSNVIWSVDGVAGGNTSLGTISPSGVYSPPSIAGSHAVVATSVADSTQTGRADVIVTNYPGTFTCHNDNARTGQNLNETVLNTANVNENQFGKLFSYQVDGQVYAQPLYVANVNIPGQGFHNVVYVATEHDSVYALDADGNLRTPLWQASFIDPAAGITTVPSADVGTPLINPEIGITGTPVIDPASGTLYVVAKTKESGNYVQRLHALDIATGAEKFGGPVVIQASVPGTGVGNDGNGHVVFDPLRHLQRPGLLLLNGVVYIAFGSNADILPYHGWVMGYDAQALRQVAVFNTTPDGSKGSIWQSGAGLAADDNGHIFAMTANGTFDAETGGIDFGESFLKLSTNGGGLTVADFFTPFDHRLLDLQDFDLGSGGPLILPEQTTSPTHLVVGAGKGGSIYLVDRDGMGQFHAGSNSNIVQFLSQVVGPVFGLYGSPAYWWNNLYWLGVADVLKVFRLSNGLLSSTPISRSTTAFAYPGATPAISANALTNGILWVLENAGAAVLHAYDAADVSQELYNSNQAGARDILAPAVKFSVPTVANGKVYVGTQDQLTILGILPQ